MEEPIKLPSLKIRRADGGEFDLGRFADLIIDKTLALTNALNARLQVAERRAAELEQRLAKFEVKARLLRFRGQWDPNRPYTAGDCVLSADGDLFIAQSETTAIPRPNEPSWRLAGSMSASR